VAIFLQKKTDFLFV